MCLLKIVLITPTVPSLPDPSPFLSAISEIAINPRVIGMFLLSCLALVVLSFILSRSQLSRTFSLVVGVKLVVGYKRAMVVLRYTLHLPKLLCFTMVKADMTDINRSS